MLNKSDDHAMVLKCLLNSNALYLCPNKYECDDDWLLKKEFHFAKYCEYTVRLIQYFHDPNNDAMRMHVNNVHHHIRRVNPRAHQNVTSLNSDIFLQTD